jgi:hypothetical protein
MKGRVLYPSLFLFTGEFDPQLAKDLTPRSS